MLEDLVMNNDEPLYSRLLAWWMILSTWGILRFDDHRGLIIGDMQDSADGWVFMLVRSKTTGPDKSVEARPGIISRGAYIRQAAWCETGRRLWVEAAPNARDYALCTPNASGGCDERELGYVEYSGRMRGVLAGLTASDGHQLGHHAAAFFTPHSFRAFMPSAAAAIGAPPEWLGWLSGWKVKAADVYVRTCRQRTSVLQSTAARVARDFLRGGDPLGEHELHDQLCAHLAGRGVTEEDRDRARRILTSYPWPPVSELLWNPSGVTRAESSTAEQGTAEEHPCAQEGRKDAPPRSPSGDLPSDDGNLGDVPRIGTGYVVSISGKRKVRRLHHWGWCHRIPGVDYKFFEEYGAVCPGPEHYHDYCHQCWRGADQPAVAGDADVDGSVASEDESSSSDGAD